MIHFVDDAVIENREEIQQKAKEYIDERTYSLRNKVLRELCAV